MKRFTLIAGSALLLALSACNTNKDTAAPGAVSGSSCCATKTAACCKESKAATCDAKAAVVAPASPGAVSGTKTDCGTKSGCSKSATGCPMSGKTNG
ncbi:MAG: hypothetical protein EXS15_00920 [Phycisphaerales bacterium]|nr:hypothetical protein [Phycisphaerales bacterium]